MTPTNDELLNNKLSHNYLVEKLETIGDDISGNAFEDFTTNIADDILKENDIALKRNDLINVLKSKIGNFWNNYIQSYLHIHKKTI